MKVMICAMVLMALTAFSVRAANVGDEVQVVFACGDLDAAKSVAKIGSDNDAAGLAEAKHQIALHNCEAYPAPGVDVVITKEIPVTTKISVYEIEPANGRKLVPHVYAIGEPSGQGA